MPPLTIRDTLQPRGPAGALVLTAAQLAELGTTRKAVPVRVTVNGHAFEGRIASMGGELLLGFSKAVRAACGVEVGEVIEARVELDEAPRAVEVPPALQAALDARPGAAEAFARWPPSRRKEAARSVAEAKQEATRERRIAKLLEALGAP